MTRIDACILIVGACFAGTTQAQLASEECLPPLPPTYSSRSLVETYEREIRAEFQQYFDEAQMYFRCLEVARTRVSEEVQTVLANYRQLFGNR